MKMNLIVENCDFYEKSLQDVLNVMSELIDKEDRDHNDVKRIRNVIDDLDSFNVSFILEDVDNVIYTMLLGMNHIYVELMESHICFKGINFPNEEMKNEYERLITQYMNLRETLLNNYNITEKELEYLEPNSRLYNVRVSLSIKDLLTFILTCSQYDETIDVVVTFSNYDGLMENIVTVALSLFDIIKPEDLFIRMPLDEENRKNVLYSNGMVHLLSNEDYLRYCIDNNLLTKVSAIGGCSLVAYKELLTKLPSHEIKIENFRDFVQQENFDVLLPISYGAVEGDLIVEVEGYIYSWYNLVNAFKVSKEYSNEAIMCCLGCFINVFKLNTGLDNIQNLDLVLSENENLLEGLVAKVCE